MFTKRSRIQTGFTLIELMISAVIVMIVGLAIGAVIVDCQTSWNTLYDRMNSDVVTDGYVVKKRFDAVIRNASRSRFVLGDDGLWIEAYFYADASSVAIDRYARFYVTDGNLKLEIGQWAPSDVISVETLCGNVSECTFKQAGRSAQMVLTLNQGTQTNTVIASAVAHNK